MFIAFNVNVMAYHTIAIGGDEFDDIGFAHKVFAWNFAYETVNHNLVALTCEMYLFQFHE